MAKARKDGAGGVTRRHWSLILVIAGVGLLGMVGSWLLREVEPWWSSTLGNMGVVTLLLIPGDFALHWVRSDFRQVERASAQAQATADDARRTAERAERSLKDVREVLMERQSADHEAYLDIFRNMTRSPSRQSLEGALRQATTDGLITKDGVRSPVWETDLHYRYVLNETGPGLEVRLETANGTVVSSHSWDAEATPEQFYQRLVGAVRAAGRDLGVMLNDPTQSVEDLSGMLLEVSRMRAQDLMGYRHYLSHIIERVDGWYFTERYVIPADDLQYGIAIERLDEMDWADHLRGKGWTGAESALDFARGIYKT